MDKTFNDGSLERLNTHSLLFTFNTKCRNDSSLDISYNNDVLSTLGKNMKYKHKKLTKIIKSCITSIRLCTHTATSKILLYTTAAF